MSIIQESTNYVVVSVSSIHKRDKLIRQIYTQLTHDPTTTFTVQQDQVNRIKVFHNLGKGNMVLVRVYLVIVIPVFIDLSPLFSIFGSVDFYLDETIQQLSSIVEKLQKLKGHKIIKGKNNAKNLEQQLARLIY